MQQLKESHYQLERKDDQSQTRIAELETKIVALTEAARERERAEEEKEKLEKMLAEQQKIIRLALARILPRKGEVAFCQVDYSLAWRKGGLHFRGHIFEFLYTRNWQELTEHQQ